MAIPEDIAELWSKFPSHMKIEPLDALFDSISKSTPEKKVFEAAVADDYLSEPADVLVTDAFEEVEPPKLKQEKGTTKGLEVVGSDNAVRNGIFKASKLYAYEDFNSFLAREGGLNPDRLSRVFVDDGSPRADEDFVAFLARSNGIKDEQMINRLRQALKLEPVIEFQPGMKPNRPVKMEVDLDLKVQEGEDAASFFVRAGSWESASTISEELASVGLNEFADEDAESFFRRMEGDNDAEGDVYVNNRTKPAAAVTLIATPKQQVQGSNEQASVQMSEPSISSDSITSEEEEVVVKKRKSSKQ